MNIFKCKTKDASYVTVTFGHLYQDFGRMCFSQSRMLDVLQPAYVFIHTYNNIMMHIIIFMYLLVDHLLVEAHRAFLIEKSDSFRILF